MKVLGLLKQLAARNYGREREAANRCKNCHRIELSRRLDAMKLVAKSCHQSASKRWIWGNPVGLDSASAA
jgi:nitrate/TMAO reductase-like tetraheme cytochrome c subunit